MSKKLQNVADAGGISQLTLIIQGKPLGKQRPKFARRGAFVTTRTPEQTVNYEVLIRQSFAAKYPEWLPVSGPVTLSITARYPIPKSLSAKKWHQAVDGVILPLVSPDGDNILKIVSDALNGIAYVDDKQIVDWHCCKRYGERPFIGICLNITPEKGERCDALLHNRNVATAKLAQSD